MARTTKVNTKPKETFRSIEYRGYEIRKYSSGKMTIADESGNESEVESRADAQEQIDALQEPPQPVSRRTTRTARVAIPQTSSRPVRPPKEPQQVSGGWIKNPPTDCYKIFKDAEGALFCDATICAFRCPKAVCAEKMKAIIKSNYKERKHDES